MKRALTILLATALLFSLAACRKEAPAPGLPALADVTANWAWAIPNGSGEEAATQLAVITYAAEADFEKLDLAIGPFGQAKVKYMGEKEGDGGRREAWVAVFEAVTGPYFAFEKPVAMPGQTLCLVDSGALGIGLVPLELQYDRETFVYPPACDADIARAEAMHAGRKATESQLLAMAADGARICVFLFEPLEEERLFSCAYMDEEGVFLSYSVSLDGEGDPLWRAEPGNDDFLMLCRTREGIIINAVFRAPGEGAVRFSLREADGALEPFGLPGYGWAIFSDEYIFMDIEEEFEEDGETP